MIKNKSRDITVGKFILDSLSIGMYNDPLMILREYIQNSVDSIDILSANNGFRSDQAKIEININGLDRRIIIKDNGGSISKNTAFKILHNIGESTKTKALSRGFRGIGRLGGLGYCDELRFITKAAEEDIYSISCWDCKLLRKLIKTDGKLETAKKVIEKISTFSQKPYSGSKKDHFFQVEMYNVKSCKEVLLDIPEVKRYLSQIAPVPFDKSNFSYANNIEEELKKQISSYRTYTITVNGEHIYKPYRNSFNLDLRGSIKDEIKDIEFVEFSNDKGSLAFGWIAQLDLLGSINSSNLFEGVRLRSGNILVGNKDLLANFYREQRFNNYLIGEIHIVNNNLILNSRRDDFEDNEYKEEFYNCFIKEIGLPYSKKIREASNLRSGQNYKSKQSTIIEAAKKIIKKGYLTELQREIIISDLKGIKKDKQCFFDNEKIDYQINKVKTSKHFLNKTRRKFHLSKKKVNYLFNTIYETCSNKVEAEKIINNILHKNIL